MDESPLMHPSSQSTFLPTVAHDPSHICESAFRLAHRGMISPASIRQSRLSEEMVAGKNRAWELGYGVRSCTVHCENFAGHACGEFVKSDVAKKQSGSASTINIMRSNFTQCDKKEGALQINLTHMAKTGAVSRSGVSSPESRQRRLMGEWQDGKYECRNK
jgi:hypothetical protein